MTHSPIRLIWYLVEIVMPKMVKKFNLDYHQKFWQMLEFPTTVNEADAWHWWEEFHFDVWRQRRVLHKKSITVVWRGNQMAKQIQIFLIKFFVWNIMKVFSNYNDWEAPCDDIKGRRYRGCVTHLILHSHFSSVPRERVCEIFAYCCQFSWRLSRARISLNKRTESWFTFELVESFP